MYSKFNKLLNERNVTSYRVSKDTGIPQTTLSSWKTGKSELKVDKLKKIANYFGVTVNYFLED